MKCNDISQKKIKIVIFSYMGYMGDPIKNLSDLAQKLISARFSGPKTSPKIST